MEMTVHGQVPLGVSPRVSLPREGMLMDFFANAFSSLSPCRIVESLYLDVPGNFKILCACFCLFIVFSHLEATPTLRQGSERSKGDSRSNSPSTFFSL